MQVANLDAHVFQVVSQIFSHFLGQGGDENTFVSINPFVNFTNKIINLTHDRSNLDLRIQQPGWPNDLLSNIVFRNPIQFIRTRSSTHI
ncbi:Uncharacterised protein [Mycobacteroides abscessus subsp. abscessus]|nr:Uncharacterised protein [Mycobacteroides abscessus subsp. abscessus]